MSTHVDSPLATKVYTTRDGRAAIEQSKDAIVVLTPDQILAVIDELRVCYDYCAAWKATDE
jgi:hypothetical protein